MEPSEIHAILSDLHIGCSCCSHLPNLSAPNNGELEKLAAQMIAAVWKQKGYSGTIDYPMTNALALQFWAGVQEGFGSTGIDYNTPDGAMLNAIVQNTWHFAAAKNYHQLRELTSALLDEEGNVRSRKDFITEAQKIVDKSIGRYLAAEYELAVAGSQMASKWVDIEKDADTLPWLTFDAVLDGQTTELCTSLDGVTLKYDHPFWNTYYPPNHFNCRSTVRRNSSGVETQNIPSAEIPKLFRSNLAKQRLIFPLDHPYFVDIPEDVRIKAIKIMPYDNQFKILQHEGDGLLREHLLNKSNVPDYRTVSKVANELAKKNGVDILPRYSDENDIGRAKILFDAKARKYPDLRINGKLYEVEEVKRGASINTLKHAISSGSKQADHVIIYLNDEFSDKDLSRLSKGRFIDHKKLQEIQYRTIDGEYKVYKRQAD